VDHITVTAPVVSVRSMTDVPTGQAALPTAFNPTSPLTNGRDDPR
jgi:hypothetical protein